MCTAHSQFDLAKISLFFSICIIIFNDLEEYVHKCPNCCLFLYGVCENALCGKAAIKM